MRNFFKGMLAAVLALVATVVQAEERVFDVNGFTFISVASGLSARVQIGPEFSVIAVSESRKDLERLDIWVDGEALMITWEPERGLASLFSSSDPLVVNVTLPAITGIEGSSGANIHLLAAEVDRFSVTITSGANAQVEGLLANWVLLNMASGANASLAGHCNNFSAVVSSGANLSADQLMCENIEVEARGGGHLSAYAVKNAVAKAYSGGAVGVYGSPASFESDESSGGSVRLN